ncbi:cell wall hydrolase [Bradyrhizobium sp. LTSP885]|uniref:cell wall hydrolase n=1 Tax=Bradyrhizobium sp. LTSP885 TaxID=1619232 RepID=UPI00069C5CB5|nr:cell wall hydrolase [Bradyrhizobium sp. LTSP885]
MANANAQNGRREVVQDPLAMNAQQPRPDRSLQIANIHAPNTPSAQSLTRDDGLTQALHGVEGILAQEFEKKKDDFITEGKVAYQSGATEQQMLETGNAFTAQGYRTLQARDNVNQWFTNATIAIDQTDKQMDPKQYQQKLMQDRADMLKGITDPNARKVASAAFEDMSPRLTSQQMLKNSEFNRGERINSFTTMISSTARTSATASRRDPAQPLALSPMPVEAVMTPSATDRDIGIRTMLGEAANEGADGLAAVAHVLRNRATDGRWPSSIAGVSRQPKQFSAWNDGPGGNDLVRTYGPGYPVYERAGEVFDAVMSGKHVDPTGGATHYYSPAGMSKLVADGDQTNTTPTWLKSETERSGGQIKIGGHIFVGKANAATERGSVVAPQVTATSLAAGTPGDINAVPSQEGVAVTGVAQRAGSNEIQQVILGYKGLNDEEKGTAVADAMRRSFDAGDDTLFRDAGGLATLYSLKVKPNEVDEVIKAQKRFNDKQQTEFNVDREKYRNDILSRAEKGDNLDAILADIDKTHKAGLLNDANAKALAQSAADKIRAEGKESSKLGNVDMLNELGGLYQQIATGGDFKTVAEQAKKIATKYDATEKDVQHIVGKMFADSQSYVNTMRSEAKTLAKDRAEQDAQKASVQRALSNGWGLGNISGTQIKITNDHGQETKVSAQEYGIQQIKDKWSKEYSDKVSRGEMQAADAKPALLRSVMLEMQQHDVVDKQTQAQLTGGLSGSLVDKDGKLKQSAVDAYDAWLSLKTAPAISPGYLSKVVGDDNTRSLLEQAYLLNSGDLNNAEALLKAHEMLSNPSRDPNDRIKKDVIWDQTLKTKMDAALLERTSHGFLPTLFQTEDRSNREHILRNQSIATKFVTDRAEVYHQMNPNESPEVSMEKAIQDMQARATPVLGNLVIDRPGKEIAKEMGVKGYGATAVEDAVGAYVEKYGDKLWGKSWKDRVPGSVGNALGHAASFEKSFSPEGIASAIAPGKFDNVTNYNNERALSPPVHVTYDAEMGVMTVDLYKDATRKQTLGNPMHIKVKSIGDEYNKDQQSVGTWTRAWDNMFRGAGKAIKDAAASEVPMSGPQ